LRTNQIITKSKKKRKRFVKGLVRSGFRLQGTFFCAVLQVGVLQCLEKQGGLDKCHLIFYREHTLDKEGEWDNWRVEGPAFVWYFRGYPHVHIWIHVADDPSVPVTSHFG
jgi:hypothetical protein